MSVEVLATDEHYCNDESIAKEWSALVLKHPDDYKLKRLVNLRDRLCDRVKKGQIPVGAATKQFEDAREELIETWRKRNEQRMIYIEDAA